MADNLRRLTTAFPIVLHFEGKLFLVPQVVIRHGKDGLVIGHIADDTGHIDKPGLCAGPLAAVPGDELIFATLTGAHQRRLIAPRWP